MALLFFNTLLCSTKGRLCTLLLTGQVDDMAFLLSLFYSYYSIQICGMVWRMVVLTLICSRKWSRLVWQNRLQIQASFSHRFSALLVDLFDWNLTYDHFSCAFTFILLEILTQEVGWKYIQTWFEFASNKFF